MADHLHTDDSSAQLREMLAVLRRRKWTIALVATMVLAAALVVSSQQTPIYRSEAQVLVSGVGFDPLQPGVAEPPNIETERQLATSLSVAELAARELEGTTAQELLQGASVAAPTDTEILVFAIEHPDPLATQLRAQALATAYLEFRRERALDELISASESVQGRINDLDRQLRRVNRRLAGGVSPATEALLQAQVSSIVGQVTLLQQQLTGLTPPEELRVGQVVEPAGVPDDPVSPRHAVTGGLALFLGLGLGVAIAFLRERLDDRLRGRDDLERRAGTPVLAVIPQIAGWKRGEGSLLAAVRDPSSVVSESYRTLRTSLLFAASQEDIKTILVTSPNAGEGKTTTVANLGVVLANAGKRVALVSADLRRPRLHRFFELVNETGLTSVLIDEVSPASAMQRPGISGLGVLASGPTPGNPAELLSSEAMDNLLWKLREIADFLLIDCPPVLAVADAAILAPLVDAVVIVADAQETPRGAVARARQQLDQVDARIIGAVLNNYDPTREGGRSQYQYVYQYIDTAPGGARVRGASRERRRGR